MKLIVQHNSMKCPKPMPQMQQIWEAAFETFLSEGLVWMELHEFYYVLFSAWYIFSKWCLPPCATVQAMFVTPRRFCLVLNAMLLSVLAGLGRDLEGLSLLKGFVSKSHFYFLLLLEQ